MRARHEIELGAARRAAEHRGESRALRAAEELIQEASREGANSARESMSHDALNRVQGAVARAEETHIFDAETRSFVSEGGSHWHTLGSLGMVELLGYSAEAHEVANAVNFLIQYGVNQELAYREKLKADREARDAETKLRAEEWMKGLLDGSIIPYDHDYDRTEFLDGDGDGAND